MIPKIISLVIFFLTYYLIIFGKGNKAVIAFSMGLLISLVKVSDTLRVSNVGSFIDFNTLGILLGMMIIVGILKTTGLFQAIAIYIVKKSNGNLIYIFVSTLIAVAILSSVLDNVTTLLLFSPIIIYICQEIEIKPETFLFPMIFAANIGGTATMIGDPPNILVGSASGTSFLKFLLVMIVPSLISLFLTILYFLYTLKELKLVKKDKLNIVMESDPKKAIVDYNLLKKGLLIFVLVIVGFFIHEYLDYEAALIALTGSAVMLMISKKDFDEISSEIEWDTLFFFVGLFAIVKALEDVHVIQDITNLIFNFTSHPYILILIVLWGSGILAAFMGAVPVVTIFIPIAKALVGTFPNSDLLWWALALGASFGGNGTISGAASNMVIVGMIENNFNRKIKFAKFMKLGMKIATLGLLVSSLYLYLLLKL
ncbi:arsenic transporter family protein [Thermosipho africanus H17ap60334]|jgi:Na+/H+ antiporter NhaD/arsenite permease-like protein|uniref:Arsenic transporter family protein n=1 Tax=Thermosipho africanus (strain TCF52B) TaxID=484019 RepID=B7IEB5_THEAB|nr:MULTISPECIES: ArsB/NhaD family transporter [Thermosipho]ACJ76342.1 arsenic transporter family protein [Thermosipho africanus TCF52B]EKF49219.1 arsenic transporter family protein [Thermosipho africanus H17ap60334]MBZ4650819.1 arsenic transporter family protein [Thermosipho sp. (in: thermotogales)]RDI91066.1 arsenic transporter family protein [Thermosipho africanus Ob7]